MRTENKMTTNYKHISINPKSNTIENVCKQHELDGWRLHSVIAVNDFEWIVILEKQEI